MLKKFIGRQERRNKMRTRGNKQKTNDEMVDSSPNIPTIVLNAGDLTTPLEKQRLAEWIQKHDYYFWEKLISNTMIKSI